MVKEKVQEVKPQWGGNISAGYHYIISIVGPTCGIDCQDKLKQCTERIVCPQLPGLLWTHVQSLIATYYQTLSQQRG